ncbi:hypothetical protein FE257_002062 [Aspergillus nanangensis]|uniref:Zn(2)-C6 fungal-type domain-containing protein n=1 Tax=Aspergillus nanangensis TaxID=2582783 RepID=A0AAD4GX33_ASPNN|nr:hypothetical protein FE257_002062 [Aspergillus nanangensis]
MYAPAPPRPKKTQIVRSRNGCKSCRDRRTKCDEKKPACGTCTRLGVTCEPVKQNLQFRVTVGPASKSHPHENSSQGVAAAAAIPNLALINSLRHSERDLFYSTYWEDQCLPALHPILLSASHFIHDFPPLKAAILALSSCNWGRINAERKSYVEVTLMGGFTPNLSQLARSQLYYSSAIRSFAKLNQQECRQNATVILAMLVIFAYIESTMGNFWGFQCHVQGLSAFLDREITHSTTNPFVKGLLTAWMQPQFLVWWARAYFSTLAFQQNQPRIIMPKVLEGSYGTFHERRVAVLSILCESHRLNFRAALKHWSRDTTDNFGVDQDETESSCLRLTNEARKLDEWLSHLPPSEQPIQTIPYDDNGVVDAAIEPVTFKCHDAALNYAYYIVSRIMQCTSFLYRLRNQDSQYRGNECSEEEPWVRLFLRIASGIDMKTCIRQNTYTIGFSGLILAVLLRCQDLASGLWIQDWLQELQNTQPTEEGSFPVYQALAVTNAINHQRAMNRDIFGFSQPVDDKGGVPKFSAYNSQIINTLLFHGKLRTSGDLFTEAISIER